MTIFNPIKYDVTNVTIHHMYEVNFPVADS